MVLQKEKGQIMRNRLLSVLLAGVLALSMVACGSSSSSSDTSSSSTDESTEESTDEESSDEAAEETTTTTSTSSEYAITDFVDYELTSGEMETFMVLYSQNAADLDVLTNLYDGLLTNDADGNLVANLATDWYTDDGGLTWTFELREDAVWVDVNGEYKADLTSADFITSMEWILNAWKNGAANTSMLIEMVEGAEDYYNYTSELSEEEAMALASDNETFLEMVGIETPDDYTVVYHCVSEKPYFDTVATYSCLYPFPAGLIDELGVENVQGMDNTTMWYSGPYIMTTYIYQNEKVMEQNPLWWGADEHTRFNTVTVKMVESVDVAYQLYQTGEIDRVTLSESNLSIISSDTSNEYYDYLVETRPTKYSYQWHWNYFKLDENGDPDENWNKAVANEAFRLSIYYGLNLTTFFQRTNSINPLNIENDVYTMKGMVSTTDGTDYVDLVKALLDYDAYDSDGETPIRYDAELGESYKEQAIEELTELGVEFPVEIDYYISASSQTALDSANVLAQAISDCLGDDYVVLNIKTYVSSLSQEVRIPQLQSFVINGWGADYGDPQNFLGQETYGDDNAYYAINYANVEDLDADTYEYQADLIATLEEYTAMVEAANEITDDLDARYEAYAEAEAYFLNHGLSIPVYYNVTWQLTNVNDYTTVYAIYGMQAYRYLDYETNYNGYTTAEYEAFAAAAEE